MGKNIFDKVDDVSEQVEGVSKQIDILTAHVMGEETDEEDIYPRTHADMVDFAEDCQIDYIWIGTKDQFKKTKTISQLLIGLSILLLIGLAISLSFNYNYTFLAGFNLAFLNFIFYIMFAFDLVQLILVAIKNSGTMQVYQRQDASKMKMLLGHYDDLRIPIIDNIRYGSIIELTSAFFVVIMQFIQLVLSKSIIGLDFLILYIIYPIFVTCSIRYTNKFYNNYVDYKMMGKYKDKDIVLYRDNTRNRYFSEEKYMEKFQWLK